MSTCDGPKTEDHAARMVFGSEKVFPAHWGEPPKHDDRESATFLPGGYGFAPPRVAAWVRDKMLADGLDPDAEEPDAKDEEEHAIAESSESVLGPYNGAVMALGAAVLVVFAVSWWRRR